MRLFHITIGTRTTARKSFEAMAPDSATATAQHLSLAQPGERVEVCAVPTEEELQAADLAYLLNQEARERRRISEVAQWERAMDSRREWW